jgi:hypothetical protein
VRSLKPASAEVEPVVLDLDIEVLAEDVLERVRPALGLLEVAVEDVLLDDSLHAG